MSDTAILALALEAMEGVGRVTAGRLLSHFASYDDLLRWPREQVLLRIKGAPRAEALVERLFDRAVMEPFLVGAKAEMEELGRKRVSVLTPRDPHWPPGLKDLPKGERPVVLYAYGAAGLLAGPVVALFARPPLTAEAFEGAQSLLRHLLVHDVVAASGASSGFDVVVHKIAGGETPPRASLLVAPCGMARLPRPLRPTVSAVVRGGGLFVSPFRMNHGPFDYDDRERALLQAALSRAAVFVEPQPGSPEEKAMTWALDAGRPVFAFPSPQHPLPEAAHAITGPVDYEWVVTAATQQAR